MKKIGMLLVMIVFFQDKQVMKYQLKISKFSSGNILRRITGRVMCRNRPNDVERENVDDIYKLAKRMLPSQILIFASTSAIAEGSGSIPLDEDSPVQSHLLDLYSKSLLRREKTLTKLCIRN